jgi:hypothetical protein
MNRTITIGILGGGTASAINLIAMLYNTKQPEFTRLQIKVHVTCIHDPRIPVQQVGESITPPVTFTLLDALKFSMLTDLEPVDGTVRFGARYYWEEANGQMFDVPYTSPGIHVNSEKFGYCILDKAAEQYPNNFKLIEDRVLSVTQDRSSVEVVCEKDTHTFDYVIDCMGMPSAEELASDLYATPDFETVNSVILYPDFQQYHEMYTSAHVHKNGWMFGVPLTHRKAWGYLYNKDITPTEEAVQAFSELKGIDAGPLRKISWKQYYRKKVLDRRILSSGNKLYFFEPHMTLPLHFYNMIAIDFLSKIARTLSDVSMLNREVNGGYVDSIDKIQDLIALNYAGTTNIDSPFWNETKVKARQRLQNSNRFQHWLKTSEQTIQGYCVHPPKIMREYIEGYGIDLKSLKRNS